MLIGNVLESGDLYVGSKNSKKNVGWICQTTIDRLTMDLTLI